MLNRLSFLLAFLSISLPGYAVELTTYIVNGTSTTLAEHDDFASLYYDSSDYGGALYEAYCGATLLNSQYVLTAAHCLFDGNGNPDEFTLLFTKVGQTEIANTSNVDGVRAEAFYYYSSFSDSSSDLWANDIAIIKLESTLNTSGAVSRATDESYRDSSNSFVTIGLGLASSSDTGTNRTLQSTNMTYVTNSYCSSDLGVSSLLTSNQICFIGANNDGVYSTLDEGVCSGDSGGPVYLVDGTDYIQVGITSFGPEECGTGNVTSVYTEISDYNSWISGVLEGSIAPQFTATDELRASYSPGSSSVPDTDSSTTTVLRSSGGSIDWFIGLCLVLIFRVRKHKHSKINAPAQS